VGCCYRTYTRSFHASGYGRPLPLRLTGRIVDILLELDKAAYAPYVTYEGKEKVLYVELLKALYGTLKAARLFWLLLSGRLQEWGFIMVMILAGPTR
jgi:hypothetical protein